MGKTLLNVGLRAEGSAQQCGIEAACGRNLQTANRAFLIDIDRIGRLQHPVVINAPVYDCRLFFPLII